MEIMIVLVIITIILGVTMRFSASQIGDLESYTLQQDFVHRYDTQQLSHTSVIFTSGSVVSGFSHVRVGGIFYSGVSLDDIQLQFIPHHVGCDLTGDVAIRIQAKSAWGCFIISRGTCYLRSDICN